MRNTRSDGARTVALLILVGVTLLYAAVARGVFLFGDDTLMFQVTESMVERRSFAVTSPTFDAVAADPTLDAAGFTASAMPGEDGRGYAKYGIGQSLVAIPAFVFATYPLPHLLALKIVVDQFGNQLTGTVIYGTSLINALLGGATVALLFLLAIELGYRQRTALALAGLLAVGTLLMHYAGTFLSEPLTALCLTAVVYGLQRAQRVAGTDRAIRWLLLSGFAAGLALATKLAIGVALVAPGLWLLWFALRWERSVGRATVRMCLAWGGPIALWLVGVGAYNAVRFGSPFDSGYGAEASAYTTPLLTGLEGLLLSPGRGLFWYNPPLLLALVGVVWFGRKHPALSLTILGMLAGTLLLYGQYYVWWGGGVWGPRFLVPLLPLLLLPAAELIERAWDRQVWRVALGAVAALGLFVSLLPLLVPFDRYVVEYAASADQLHAALWQVADSPIVVAVRDVLHFRVTLDIAAVRYADVRLTILTLVMGLAGLLVLLLAVRRVNRAESAAQRSRPAMPDMPEALR
ncbi:MAG: phospholipid carrier-dependent glycosyltransferase [Thermomicrobiales bacterium]|nr:phospholipid carrier-dependent glycosyltransferase [Thermomicrobiales bacterium]